MTNVLKSFGIRGVVASNYSWVLPYLKNKRKLDFFIEVGSRDALDAIFLSRFLQVQGVAFECVPKNVRDCLNNVRISGESRLSIDERCLTDFSGEVTFNAIDSDKHDNPGAGSLFELDFSTRHEMDPDRNLGSIQRTISVKAVRFDETNYPTPHTVFMDVQGAELLVLKGFGSRISKVTNVVLETSLVSTYKTGATFWEIYDFLHASGFRYVISNRFGTDFPPVELPEIFDGEFDVLFSRH
jgi:FkbM family methyltransferase